MEIIIEDVQFLNLSLGETVPTTYLRANIGDVIQSTIPFRFESYLIASGIVENEGDTVIYARPPVGVTQVLFDSRILWTDTVNGFELIEEGDEVTLTGSGASNNGAKTVLEKIDNQTLMMSTSYSNPELLPIGSVAYVSTNIESIEYFHNLLENQESISFISKTDGSTQKAVVSGISNLDLATEHPLTQIGYKSYQYGSLTIVGNGLGDGNAGTQVSQAFILTHTFVVSPLFVASQINDIKNNVPPQYYINNNCLKYVLEIQASLDLTNPNHKKSVVRFETLGNTGYLGENFNTQLTNYSTSSLAYKREDLTVNDALELTTNETTIEFNVTNTTDTPFSDGNTKLVFWHSYLPTPEDQYRLPQFAVVPTTATDNLFKENFIFDRIECTLGTLATTPDNLGTPIQIIKECETTYMSDSLINVKVTIAMSGNASTRIAANNHDYLIALSVRDHTKSGSDADNVTLKVDVDEYFIDTTDPTMVNITQTFLEHPYNLIGTEDTSTVTAFVDDDILGIAKITLDQNSRIDDEIRLVSAVCEIVAKNGSEEFTLDSTTIALGNSLIINDIPYIDFTQSRGFATPADELRTNIRLFSDTAIDGAGIFNYEFRFPFIMRWESWEPLPAADDLFFNTSLQNNGKNHNWVRYATFAGWSISLKTTINATKNGTPQVYNSISPIDTKDYTDGLSWDTENIKSYDNDTLDPLLSGGLYGLQALKDSRVEAQMTYADTDGDPVVGDLVCRMGINVFEKGNFKEQRTLSSVYTAHPNTWLKSTDTSDLVVITNPSGSIFEGKCLVQGGLLPSGETFKFFQRFYDLRAETPVPFDEAKLQEDLELKTLEATAGFKILEQ